MGLVEQLTDIKTRLNTVLEESKTALTDKGVEVPEDMTLDGLAALVESIEAGGGGGLLIATGTYTPAADVSYFDVQHNLGVIPCVAFYRRSSFARERYKLCGFCYHDTTNNETEHWSLQMSSATAFFPVAESKTMITDTTPYGRASFCYGTTAYAATENTIRFGNETQSAYPFKSGNSIEWVVIGI